MVEHNDEVGVLSVHKKGNITWIKTTENTYLPATVEMEGVTHTLLEPVEAEIEKEVQKMSIGAAALDRDPDGPAGWDCSQVWDFTNNTVNSFMAGKLREHKIDGRQLLDLTEEILSGEIGLDGSRKEPMRTKLLSAIQVLKSKHNISG